MATEFTKKDFEQHPTFNSLIEDLNKVHEKNKGVYPTGEKLHEKDKGSAGMAVTSYKGLVHIIFAEPVEAVGFSPEEAITVAKSMYTLARREMNNKG